MNPAELDSETWARISALLDELLELPAGERAARLDGSGLDDTARRHIEALLAADAGAVGFLDARAAEGFQALVGTDEDSPPTRDDGPAGARIGPWRITRELGRGGMGTVFLAERGDGHFDQRVALKVVKRGMDTDRVLKRFLAERQILARLSHPHVARLLDGGVTEDGRPYFAMEYVEGTPILAYAAQQGLDREGRLRLLDDVCDAVQYAHRNRVVHRDLKPSNILVTPEGQVKLLDFGIAKLLDSDDDGLTATGERVMTPEYAAPEQLRGEPVTAATDVYALGLLLHELVTGRRFRRGGSTPTGQGDLDAILETALREEPDRRYTSVEALREDLRRFAASQPVLARRGVRGRRVRLATVVASLAVAAAAWGLRERPQPPALASSAIVLAVPDTSQLGAGESWIGDALQRLVIDDLGDAWRIDARAASGAPDADAALVKTRLWRDAGGQLRMALSLPPRPPHEIHGSSLRDLSQAAARHIVETVVPEGARHPTAQELQDVGTRDAEAWRQFRRARRAARMRLLERVRDLARDAIRRDPGFALAWMELAMTYEWSDQARFQALDQAIELGDRPSGLSPVSRLTIDLARHSRRVDEAAMVRVIAAIEKLPLENDDLLYLKSRQAEMDTEAALPLIEWIAEKWSHDAAAPKRLANSFLGSREPSSLPLALRYGQMAAALAPHDVAARANFARALLLSGDEAAARAHLRIIASADPEEKRDAFAGEHSNRLFLLHMSLGEIEEAVIDARRLLMGSGARHAEGQIALAVVELARGAFDPGLEALGAAAAEYEALRMETAAARVHWERAWQAYNLGRHRQAVSSCGQVLRLKRSAGNVAQLPTLATALSTLAASEGRSPALDAATAARLRKQLAGVSKGWEYQRWREDQELLIRYRLKEWAGVSNAYRRREGPVPPLTVTWYAALAAERLGQENEAARLYVQLATHPHAWQQPYRRGQAWLRLGVLRERAGDGDGARAAYESLLQTWDRAPRELTEIREAERRLKKIAASAAPPASIRGRGGRSGS